MPNKKSEKQESFDVISFKIFQKIFKKVFKVDEKKDLWDVDYKEIDKNNVFLLFFWPLIITKRYLCPHMEIDLFKKQCELNHILSSNYKLDEILNNINHFNIDSEYKENINEIEELFGRLFEDDEMIESFSDILKKEFEICIKESRIIEKTSNLENMSYAQAIDLFLGGKESVTDKSIFNSQKIIKKLFFAKIIEDLIESDSIGLKIRNGIFYYYLILLFFLFNYDHNTFEDEDSFSPYIKLQDIITLMDEYDNKLYDEIQAIMSDSLQILVPIGTYKFIDTLKLFLNDYENIFTKNEMLNADNEQEYQFYKSNPDYVACLSDNNDGEGITITVTRLMKIFEEMSYGIYFWFEKNVSSDEFSEILIFECDESKDQIAQMLHCLFLIAKQLSIRIYDYTNSYNKFLSNADIFVDQNLDSFLDKMDLIRGSYSLFEEYLEHKDFSMAIENLDMNLDDNRIKKFRNEIKRTKKGHLPPQLIQDLIAANNEITILYSIVERRPEPEKKAIAKKYFLENPNYFKILNKNDFEFIDFKTDSNRRRLRIRRSQVRILPGAPHEI
jgi:hypothetical protein